MYEDKHHPKKDIIISKLEKKYDTKVESQGYLPGPKLYAFVMFDYNLYQTKAFKKTVKYLGKRYGGGKRRWYISCIPKS